jgi:hypothetical protein
VVFPVTYNKGNIAQQTHTHLTSYTLVENQWSLGVNKIAGRDRNHFSNLVKVHAVSELRHTEVHAAEPLVAEPSAFKVEMAIEKVKGHISQGTDRIPAELIKAVGRTTCFEIHNLLILFGIRRNCLSRSR